MGLTTWLIVSVAINALILTKTIVNNYKKDKDTSITRLSIRGAKGRCQDLMAQHYGIDGRYDRGGLKYFHSPFKDWCDKNHIDCKALKSMQMYLSQIFIARQVLRLLD